MIYLDTSALAKLVVEEKESQALALWLDDQPDTVMCTSVIARVELLRACRRRGPESAPRTLALLAELALVPLSSDVIESAWSVDPVGLRSLDAIHVASAASQGGDLNAFVAFDSRLIEAARDIGLPVAVPA